MNCPDCESVYVGEITSRLVDRFNGHNTIGLWVFKRDFYFTACQTFLLIVLQLVMSPVVQE